MYQILILKFLRYNKNYNDETQKCTAKIVYYAVIITVFFCGNTKNYERGNKNVLSVDIKSMTPFITDIIEAPCNNKIFDLVM